MASKKRSHSEERLTVADKFWKDMIDVYWAEESIKAVLENSPIRSHSPIIKEKPMKPINYKQIRESISSLSGENVTIVKRSVLDESFRYLLLEGDDGRRAIFKSVTPGDDDYTKAVNAFRCTPLFPPGTEFKLKVIDIHFGSDT